MSNLETHVDLIRAEHRKRNFAMDSRKRQDLALGAYLRIALGYRTPPTKVQASTLSKEETAKIAATNKAAVEGAAAIVTEAERLSKMKLSAADRKEAVAASPVPHFQRLGDEAIISFDSRLPLKVVEDQAAKSMAKLAEQLPVWSEFGEPIRGFGELSLAVIIAEAGNLSKYPNPGKLWRRMGLAPHIGDDGRDHLPSALRKMKLTASEWEIIKYSPSRRSRMFVIADSLLKQQSEYRDLFLERRAYEHRKAEAACLIPATEVKATVEAWAKLGLPPLTLVKKLDPDVHSSAGHMTAKARVYVEKRLLKNLWREWRRLDGLSYEEPVEIKNAA